MTHNTSIVRTQPASTVYGTRYTHLRLREPSQNEVQHPSAVRLEHRRARRAVQLQQGLEGLEHGGDRLQRACAAAVATLVHALAPLREEVD